MYQAVLWAGAPLQVFAAPVILAGCSRVAVYFIGPTDEHYLGQGVPARPR